MQKQYMQQCISIVFLLFCIVFFSQAGAQTLPHFLAFQKLIKKPDLSQYSRVRFLTTPDFPPFNYVNGRGELAGYNMDLVRAICQELQIETKCQIQVVLWDDLIPHLQNKQGEVIIAGLVPNQETRHFVEFTPYYLRFPARFLLNKAYDEQWHRQGLSVFLNVEKIGVVANTRQEQVLLKYFSFKNIVKYPNQTSLFYALSQKQIGVIFGDSFLFSRWLLTDEGRNCCHFVSGDYFIPQLLNNGMAMALRKDDQKLLYALNYALQQLEKKGKLQELYLRYFPIGFWADEKP